MNLKILPKRMKLQKQGTKSDGIIDVVVSLLHLFNLGRGVTKGYRIGNCGLHVSNAECLDDQSLPDRSEIASLCIPLHLSNVNPLI